MALSPTTALSNSTLKFQKAKFDSLPLKQRHKKAAELLRAHYTAPQSSTLAGYQTLASYLALDPVEDTQEALSNRYHLHLILADQSHAEHNLLPTKQHDHLSGEPFLPNAIYLDNLRSAFNVGSILRTVEAFRLGSVLFGGLTPTADNPKVQKASMGCANLVPRAAELPRPFIALETAESATPIQNFQWPEQFTLIVGNEEYGVSQEMLDQTDHIVSIDLHGGKGSLNVGVALGIAGSYIRNHSKVLSEIK